MEINEDQLKQILDQVKNLDEDLIYSGLTILSKDLAEFFGANGLNSKDVNSFQETYRATLNIEREYCEEHEPPTFSKIM